MAERHEYDQRWLNQDVGRVDSAKRAHIVCAHPEPSTFFGALCDITQEALEHAGWQTTMTYLQAADFSDHEDAFNRLDCIVLGASPDDCLTHADFQDEHGLSIRLLADTEVEVCKLYGVWREKEVDGVKRKGVLRSTFIIDKSGVIRHALYDVAPRGHVAEVLALVKQLEPEKANANSKKQRRNA